MEKRICLLYLFLLAFLSCKKNNNDPAATTTNGSNTPYGHITAEFNGKLTTLYGDLRAYPSTDGLVYYMYGAQDFGSSGVQSISFMMAVIKNGSAFNVNTLKGVHNSGREIDKFNGDLTIIYEQSSSTNRTDYVWIGEENCIVEVTSTDSPWIEGTFSANSDLKPSGSAPGTVSIKNGKFKIKYQ